MRSAASRLPYEIRDALIEACGRLFWYRDSYRSFLVSAGVPAELYERYSEQSKYKIARLVLADLDTQGDEGFLIQRQLVTDFCKLRNAPAEAPDRDAALQALRHLKEAAFSQKLFVESDSLAEENRRRESRQVLDKVVNRARQIDDLAGRFKALLLGSDDEQARGFALESILSQLFALSEIPYRKSYRTETEQIDGHFAFHNFDYLVEARWRKDPPTESDLAALKIKADKKITSTRALFVSIAGFRRQVVAEFTRGITSNIILMDGADLMAVLEQRVSLIQLLEYKTQKAAQEGVIYAAVSEIL